MTDRSIILDAWEVRQILVGRKTSLTRLAKFRGEPGLNLEFSGLVPTFITGRDRWVLTSRSGAFSTWSERSEYLASPVGTVGDRVSVKEMWRAPAGLNARAPGDLPADPSTIGYVADEPLAYLGASGPAHLGRRRPASMLPEWARRLHLEILDVQVKRAGGLSKADMDADGVVDRIHPDGVVGPSPVSAADRKAYTDARSLWFGWFQGKYRHRGTPMTFVFHATFQVVTPG